MSRKDDLKAKIRDPDSPVREHVLDYVRNNDPTYSGLSEFEARRRYFSEINDPGTLDLMADVYLPQYNPSPAPAPARRSTRNNTAKGCSVMAAGLAGIVAAPLLFDDPESQRTAGAISSLIIAAGFTGLGLAYVRNMFRR